MNLKCSEVSYGWEGKHEDKTRNCAHESNDRSNFGHIDCEDDADGGEERVVGRKSTEARLGVAREEHVEQLRAEHIAEEWKETEHLKEHEAARTEGQQVAALEVVQEVVEDAALG